MFRDWRPAGAIVLLKNNIALDVTGGREDLATAPIMPVLDPSRLHGADA
jgi:hypothetical protein